MHPPRPGVASSRSVLLTALLMTLAIVVAGAPAQEPPSTRDTARGDEARRYGIFLDSLDVSLVNLEVSVTTPDGEPVADLTIDDFAVLDDGAPVALTHFYRVETEGPAPGSKLSRREPGRQVFMIRGSVATQAVCRTVPRQSGRRRRRR